MVARVPRGYGDKLVGTKIRARGVVAALPHLWREGRQGLRSSEATGEGSHRAIDARCHPVGRDRLKDSFSVPGRWNIPGLYGLTSDRPTVTDSHRSATNLERERTAREAINAQAAGSNP